MKKIVFLFIISFLFVACGSYKTVDLGKLTTGMSKAEVEYLIGPPERILAVNDRREGFQEVLQYRTNRNEIYALEFWNDYLTGFEYLYDDVTYVPAPAPPVVYPPRGRPIYIINDSHPGRPGSSVQPNPNPSRPGTPRPGSSGSGSSSTRPSVRPDSGSSRPSTRPGTSTGSGTTGNNTRPTTRPSDDKSSSSRPATNTESGRSSSGSESGSSSSGRSR